jgi:hypothetical protein
MKSDFLRPWIRDSPRLGAVSSLKKKRWTSAWKPSSGADQFMTSRDGFELANERAMEMERSIPRVVAAHYDRQTGRIVVELSSKVFVAFSPRDVEGLEDAKPAQLNAIEISPSGFGIHFPAVDADLYVPGILEGFLGSKRWMASRLGQTGGQSRSRAKKAAARTNGKLGGRPRKAVGGRSVARQLTSLRFACTSRLFSMAKDLTGPGAERYAIDKVDL